MQPRSHICATSPRGLSAISWESGPIRAIGRCEESPEERLGDLRIHFLRLSCQSSASPVEPVEQKPSDLPPKTGEVARNTPDFNASHSSAIRNSNLGFPLQLSGVQKPKTKVCGGATWWKDSSPNQKPQRSAAGRRIETVEKRTLLILTWRVLKARNLCNYIFNVYIILYYIMLYYIIYIYIYSIYSVFVCTQQHSLKYISLTRCPKVQHNLRHWRRKAHCGHHQGWNQHE